MKKKNESQEKPFEPLKEVLSDEHTHTEVESINSSSEGQPEKAETPDERESLKVKLDQKAKESADNFDKFMRLQAEFENYKKRSQKELFDYRKYANANLIKELIDVIENLERAIEAASSRDHLEALKEGVEITFKQFMDILTKEGLKPIDCLHKSFDPALHEALAQEPTDEYPENTVMQVFQKGYSLKDKILKHAKVVVSKKTVEAKEASGDEKSTEPASEEQSSINSNETH